MSKNKKPQTPPHFMLGGEKYVQVLLRITSRREESNIPDELMLLTDADIVELANNDQFMIAFIMERMIKPGQRRISDEPT